MPRPFYRRDLNLEAWNLADASFEVRTLLGDAAHSMSFAGQVDSEGRLSSPVIQAARMPFLECSRAAGLASMLEGHHVSRPLPVEVVAVLREGCFHALEIVEPSLRFAANVRAGIKAGWPNMHPPSPKTPQAMRLAKLDGCAAFRDGRPQLNRKWRNDVVGP